MFTAERLVFKYRRFFRIAVPTIVAADTVRSVLVVAKLAQDRLREWDEEQQYEIFDNTKDILKRVVLSCHAKERDFWPKEISNAAGVLSQDNSKLNNPLTLPDKSQEESSKVFQGGSKVERCARHPGPLVIEYVTWGEVWSHASQAIMHAIHCSMSNMLFHGGQLSLVKAGSTLCGQTSSVVLEAADTVGEWCRRKLPWPQCTLSRRSALRWSIAFHAVSWPSNLGTVRPPLELDLTAY